MYAFCRLKCCILDVFYKDEKELSLDLVKCLNREIRALSEAGCVYIQVDEPLIARHAEKAVEFGIDHLKMCFEVKHFFIYFCVLFALTKGSESKPITLITCKIIQPRFSSSCDLCNLCDVHYRR